jgi:hypothetical protein
VSAQVSITGPIILIFPGRLTGITDHVPAEMDIHPSHSCNVQNTRKRAEVFSFFSPPITFLAGTPGRKVIPVLPPVLCYLLVKLSIP